jgi:hypothetical protein
VCERKSWKSATAQGSLRSSRIVIERPLLRIMGLKIGTYVDVDADGTTLVLQRSKSQEDDDECG